MQETHQLPVVSFAEATATFSDSSLKERQAFLDASAKAPVFSDLVQGQKTVEVVQPAGGAAAPVAPVVLKRGRGRPPKVKPVVTVAEDQKLALKESFAEGEDDGDLGDEDDDAKEAVDEADETKSDLVPKKKRGRPPKKVVAQPVEEDADVYEEEDTEVKEKKQRGRPPNKKVAAAEPRVSSVKPVSDTTPESSESSEPVKRGKRGPYNTRKKIDQNEIEGAGGFLRKRNKIEMGDFEDFGTTDAQTAPTFLRKRDKKSNLKNSLLETADNFYETEEQLKKYLENNQIKILNNKAPAVENSQE